MLGMPPRYFQFTCSRSMVLKQGLFYPLKTTLETMEKSLVVITRDVLLASSRLRPRMLSQSYNAQCGPQYKELSSTDVNSREVEEVFSRPEVLQH